MRTTPEHAISGIMEFISRGVFGIASGVLMLIALALSIYSGGLIFAALRGPWSEAGTGLLGLDAVAAAAEGTIHSVKMTTRKPPNGLAGAPHLVKNGISVDGLNEAKLVFSGTARDAAAGFPANVNVVAALALAGIGPDRTMIDIYADPTKTRNCHIIEVDADSARFTLSIENVPSENPKTGRITAQSALAALRKLHAPLRVGT